MKTNADIFSNQRGGSTLIGLALGLCLGMLALIKWPQLEAPITALLTEYDIKISNDGGPESGLGRDFQTSEGLVHDTFDGSVFSPMPTQSKNPREKNTPEAPNFGTNSPAVPLATSRPRVADIQPPASTNRGDWTHAENIPKHDQHATKIASDTRLVDRPDGFQATTPVADQGITGLKEPSEQDDVRYETLEVWQAFSSEAAAKAFAAVVSNALKIEVQTQQQSDHKVVPVIRCEEQRRCDSVSAEIAALLAGSTNSEVRDEI